MILIIINNRGGIHDLKQNVYISRCSSMPTLPNRSSFPGRDLSQDGGDPSQGNDDCETGSSVSSERHQDGEALG